MQLIRFIVKKPSVDVNSVSYRVICDGLPFTHIHSFMCFSYVVNIVTDTYICYMYRIEVNLVHHFRAISCFKAKLFENLILGHRYKF